MPATWSRMSPGSSVRVLVATCDICGCEAHFGFERMWACREHRAEVEASFVVAKKEGL